RAAAHLLAQSGLRLGRPPVDVSGALWRSTDDCTQLPAAATHFRIGLHLAEIVGHGLACRVGHPVFPGKTRSQQNQPRTSLSGGSGLGGEALERESSRKLRMAV